MLNKDFLRQVFKEEKSLLSLDEVKWISVPRYADLAVEKIHAQFVQDKSFMRYFPDSLPKGRVYDRTYFFNVLSTVHPEYTSALVNHANN